ncbi:TAXI family TRAP transporter solute-binding subunit [Fretibacterium sp. OH1220_COT-178]|nr:TAXI family TRAP transporter solute-binding subunit [Fretibacterium sp. OH1220_COT-178]RRD66204.1 TAXI family TRAP transporter solute-binding subunit [Fretibacterium sp. OH1220_COT-178]
MKRMLSVLIVVGFVLTMGLAASAAEKTFLSIATGGVAGTYYPLGGGLAQVMNKHVPNVEVTAETGNASAANINLIAGHEVSMALVQNDVSYMAIRGEKPFNKPVENLRMIASLYPEHVQCITVKGSGIRTLMEIKGKRVSVGAPGSGVAGSLNSIFSAAGIKYSDMNTDFLDFANTAERLQDGQLDAGFLLAGYPTAAVMALAAQKDIDLVAFDEELLDNLVKQFPYFTKDVVPAGTYKGVDHDTPTPAVMAILVCDATMPDDLVYNIVKAVFENLDELKPVHDKAKLISLETALKGASISVHPGAAKYYKEKGMAVPEVR